MLHGWGVSLLGRRPFARLAVLLLFFGLWACEVPSQSKPILASATGARKMAAAAYAVAEREWRHVPVPPRDAEAVAPLSLASPVLALPQGGADPVGYLRLGEKVPRSDAPLSRDGCAGGWYAVRPVGFVCIDKKFTLDMNHPVARAFPSGPNRSQPLPYHYAFVRSVAPNYLKVPTKEEQLSHEMRLEKHLRSYARLHETWDAMTPGANEVPLSSTGAASELEPRWVAPPPPGARYGGDPSESAPWWLSGGRKIPNLSTFRAPPYAVMAGRVKRHAGVALLDSFVAGQGEEARRFAVSVDGRLIPADKLKPETGSPFHGFELGPITLPVAIVRAEDGARPVDSADAEPRPRRSLVELSGEVRVRGGQRQVREKSGAWLKSDDLRIAAAPSALPWFAKNRTHWIDISLLSQTLVLYEGERPVYVTLVSSGRDGIGDPKETLSTPTGVFRIYQKHVTNTMDSSVADSEFELRDVPWVMYFQGGYALHAAYWHDDFGKPRSHGCVNLAPIDARYIFNWTSPDVPEGWHGAYAGETFGKGTLISIHP